MKTDNEREQYEQDCNFLLMQILEELNKLPSDEHIQKGKKIIQLFQSNIKIEISAVNSN